MTVASFGPDISEYEIYQGKLRSAWFVRQNGFDFTTIIGVGRDQDHAIAIMQTHKAEQDNLQRENPIFLFAA